MKKNALVFVGLSVLLLGACGNSSEQPSDNAEPKQEQSASNQLELNKAATIDQYDITIKDMKVTNSMQGGKVLLLTYDFTNNSDETTSSDVQLYFQGFQDGVETNVENGTYVEGQNQNSEVAPGSTSTDNQQAVTIDDESKPIEVRISSMFGDDSDELTLEVDDLISLE